MLAVTSNLQSYFSQVAGTHTCGRTTKKQEGNRWSALEVESALLEENTAPREKQRQSREMNGESIQQDLLMASKKITHGRDKNKLSSVAMGSKQG